jgi:hypothetical protein
MQFIIEDAVKSRTLKDSAISIPNSHYTSKILEKNIEVNLGYLESKIRKSTIMEMWDKQHPLIHTWLLISSISICCLSAVLYFL